MQHAIKQSRELMTSLHPDLIDNIGLVSALERLVSNFIQTNDIKTHLQSPAIMDLPSNLTISIYRVAQEALANVAKHGEAKKVQVILEQSDGYVSLRVLDDGKGFDPVLSQDRLPFDSKFGLFYIQQRVESLGGETHNNISTR